MIQAPHQTYSYVVLGADRPHGTPLQKRKRCDFTGAVDGYFSIFFNSLTYKISAVSWDKARFAPDIPI